MKKAFITILAMVYLSISMGATIHMHYCMGKLVETGLWHGQEDRCSSCSMEKKDSKQSGCCKDEHKQVKFEKDQKVTDQAIQLIGQMVTTVPVQFSFQPIPMAVNLTTSFPVSHAPPRSSDKAIFLRNCNFRI